MTTHAPPEPPVKGRGATFKPANRLRVESPEPSDDGPPPHPDTHPAPLPARHTPTTTPPPPPHTPPTHPAPLPPPPTINPYQGCEHGCIYCYARPSHSYLDLSPGIDFETKLFAKPDAAKLLRAELAKPGYRCDPIALGTNTDPYQPIEREWKVTRSILEVLAEHEHPFTIVTKSALVERDIDLIAPMAAKRMARVHLSITPLHLDLTHHVSIARPKPLEEKLAHVAKAR